MFNLRDDCGTLFACPRGSAPIQIGSSPGRHWDHVNISRTPDGFAAGPHLNMYDLVSERTKVLSVLSSQSETVFSSDGRTDARRKDWTFEELLGPVIGSGSMSLSRASTAPSDPIKRSKAVLPQYRPDVLFDRRCLSSGSSLLGPRHPREKNLQGKD